MSLRDVFNIVFGKVIYAPAGTREVRRQRRKILTDKMVAALPRKRKRYIKTDPEQRGMYVRVPPAGPCVFAAVARGPCGKQIWITIGRADLLKIEDARKKAREALRRIKAGRPLAAKRQDADAVEAR